MWAKGKAIGAGNDITVWPLQPEKWETWALSTSKPGHQSFAQGGGEEGGVNKSCERWAAYPATPLPPSHNPLPTLSQPSPNPLTTLSQPSPNPLPTLSQPSP